MTIIVVRLFFIQILQHEMWVEKAQAQQIARYTIPAKRGQIYMLDGEEPVPVVMNTTVYTVIVDPMLANREQIAAKISEIVGDAQVAKWDEVFADRTLRYYVVARNVGRKAAEQIAEADFDGVWLSSSTKRVYPEGMLGSALLGFVNADGEGQYGVEGALNEELAGTDGLLQTVKDVNNVALSIGNDNVRTPAVDGQDIVLTIDRNLQYGVEKILAQKIQEMKIANMSAVVMNPRNGEILAMANLPGYDPADYGNVESADAYINYVTEEPFEPASVCKTFTFATGIEYGVMKASSTFVNQGVTHVDGWPIENAEKAAYLLGEITMQTAFDHSLNTGSTQVLRWLGGSETEILAQGRERLYDYYYNHFGLGRPTGVELYESNGVIYEPDAEMYGIDSTYANMTFGQNMQATMLQVVAAFASVINGGNYYKPTIVKGVLENDVLAEKEQAGPERRTVSEETSAAMREMLYGVRYASRADGTDAAGYYVGGKTGTAQVIVDGAYSMTETQGTYIGFGGTAGEMPEYVIMVRIWEKNKKVSGQTHGLPVFNVVKAYVQDYLKIRPAE